MTETVSRSRWGIEEPTIDPATADALIAQYVQPHRDGERHLAYSTEGAVQVWALIGYLRGATVAETAAAYDISEAAMLAAIAYYQRHRELIDAQLLLMDESWR